jgi:hypothetical protein
MDGTCRASKGQAETKMDPPEPQPGISREQPAAGIALTHIRQALYRKMRQYAGEGGKGIEGVWNAIDSRYKYSPDTELEGIRGGHNGQKIKKAAFTRAATRLTDNPENENIHFGISGSTLLTLNILEILGLFNRSALLDTAPPKRSVRRVIGKSYHKISAIDRNLTSLSILVETALMRTPRFTAYKLSHDWENILLRTREIINGGTDPDFLTNEALSGMKSLMRQIITTMPPGEPRFALSLYNLFYDYTEYFYQDTILFSFYKSLTDATVGKIVDLRRLYISPVYALRFFTKMNQRFLSMLNTESEKTKMEPFQNEMIKVYDDAYERVSNGIKNEKLRNLMHNLKPGLFLYKENKAAYKASKRIIELLMDNDRVFPSAVYEKSLGLTKEYIAIFYEVYVEKAGINQDNLRQFLEQCKCQTLKDMYSLIAMGRPNIFYLTEKLVEKMIKTVNDIEDYADRLSREYGNA